MAEQRNTGEDWISFVGQEGGKRIVWWLTGGGLALLIPGLLILIAVVAGVVLLAGIGGWAASLLGPHPPAIATEASRPTEWLTALSREAITLNVPNSLAIAVMHQASDGQVFGDRWYCSNGQTTGEPCHVAYHPGVLGIGPHGVHNVGIGFSLMGLNNKDVTIPAGDHHKVAWNLAEGMTLLAGTLHGAAYWQSALNAFHAHFQAPPGWKSTVDYAQAIARLLGTYETISTNGGPPVKRAVVAGPYNASPDLGAWALAPWSRRTGQFEDPQHQPEWVFVVGAAPVGAAWAHPWSPPTVQTIPSPTHSQHGATHIVTRYYLWGRTLLPPVSVRGTLKNGRGVAFTLSTQNPEIPAWSGGTVWGVKVPLTGPDALTSITATWPNPSGHNTLNETILWPEQPQGTVSTVARVPDTKTVCQWWPDIFIASQKTGVPATWIAAEMENESGGTANAGLNGLTGAYGLMQLEPQTARTLPGYYPGARQNPQESLILGAELLAELHAQFGSWRIASAAYYAGAGSVESDGVHAGMTWSQAAPLLNAVPFASVGNNLTAAQYADNIKATAQVIAKQHLGCSK